MKRDADLTLKDVTSNFWVHDNLAYFYHQMSWIASFDKKKHFFEAQVGKTTTSIINGRERCFKFMAKFTIK